MTKLFLLLLLGRAAFAQGTVPTAGTWTAVSMHGGPIQLYGYDKTTYIPTLKAHCSWGAYHFTVSSEPNDGLVCYSYSENRSSILATGPMMHNERYGSLGHGVGDQIYVPADDSLYYITDGSTSTGIDHYLGRWVQFDMAGLAQRDRTTVGTAQVPWLTYSGVYSCMGYDSANNKALLFPNYLDKASVWDQASNTWSAASNTGIPTTPLQFPTCAYNSDNGLIYLYGGGTADIWTYNAGTNAWNGPLAVTCSGVDCSGGKPGFRQGAFLAYSTVDHVFLMGGGGTGPSSGEYTDTWTFNPSTLAWAEQTPAASYVGMTWERVQYDADSNVFVMVTNGSSGYADGSWASYPAKVYVYPLSGSGGSILGYGRTANTYTPASGAISIVTPTVTSNSAIGSQSYGTDPSIATDGTNIYAGWRETGTWFDSTTCGANEHGYVRSNAGTGAWTSLGATCTALTPAESTTATRSGGHLQLGVVGSIPWAAQTEGTLSGGGHYPWTFAYSWNGSAWSGGQIGCVAAACSGSVEQFAAKLISVAGTPTVALVETTFTTDPPIARLYVMQYSGGVWSAVGGAALNHSTSAGNRVLGASIAADGSNIYACWDESVSTARYTISAAAQLYCKKWNGSTWSAEIGGGSRNVTAGSWAGSPSVAVLSGTLYTGWTERATNGAPILYTATWNGTTWTASAGLNHTSGGWAVNPKVASDGSNVWLAWEEQAATGQRSIGYVSKLVTGSWSAVGSGIYAGSSGSIESIELAIVSAKPTVVFAEASPGNLRQIYTKQWSGNAWGAIGCTQSVFPMPTGFQRCQ